MQFTNPYCKRPSVIVGSKQAQTLLAKSLLEFAPNVAAIATVAAASKSIQNSSLAANCAIAIELDQYSITLFRKDSVFDPTSAQALQFTDTLTVTSFEEPPMGSCSDAQRKADLLNFFNDLKNTKYFTKSIKNLTFNHAYNLVIRSFFTKPTDPTKRETNAASLIALSEAWTTKSPEDDADRPYAKFDNLQHLELKYFLPTCDAELDLFNNGLPSLTSFSVRCGLHLSDARLALLYKCAKITALSFGVAFNLTDDKFNGISALKKLQRLDLSMANQLGPKALEYVAGCRGTLKYLDVSISALIDDEALKHVAKLDELEVLHMEHLQKVTNDGLDRLFGKNTFDANPKLFHQLRDLYLDVPSSSVTEVGYSHLQNVTARTQLRLVSFKHCSVTDQVLHDMFTKHPENNNILSVLDLSDCKAITDAALSDTISTSLLNLTEVDFSGCENVSDVGVTSVMTQCLKLKKLSVKNCARVSEKVRGEIQQKYGN